MYLVWMTAQCVKKEEYPQKTFFSVKSVAMADTSTSTENYGGPLFSYFFEYDTPKVVNVRNVPMGILRLVLHTGCISFVVLYQLWYARGYQEFGDVESSLTTKIKGFST